MCKNNPQITKPSDVDLQQMNPLVLVTVITWTIPSYSSASFMSCVRLLHLCLIIITDSSARKLWQASLTHAVPAGSPPPPSSLIFLLPHLRSSAWMDWSVVHRSPQLQIHPCCYIRAMQRLTNQIIIATGHTLKEDRGQWSDMANQ